MQACVDGLSLGLVSSVSLFLFSAMQRDANNIKRDNEVRNDMTFRMTASFLRCPLNGPWGQQCRFTGQCPQKGYCKRFDFLSISLSAPATRHSLSSRRTGFLQVPGEAYQRGFFPALKLLAAQVRFASASAGNAPDPEWSVPRPGSIEKGPQKTINFGQELVYYITFAWNDSLSKGVRAAAWRAPAAERRFPE
jgi:hypothetical protein